MKQHIILLLANWEGIYFCGFVDNSNFQLGNEHVKCTPMHLGPQIPKIKKSLKINWKLFKKEQTKSKTFTNKKLDLSIISKKLVISKFAIFVSIDFRIKCVCTINICRGRKTNFYSYKYFDTK